MSLHSSSNSSLKCTQASLLSIKNVTLGKSTVVQVGEFYRLTIVISESAAWRLVVQQRSWFHFVMLYRVSQKKRNGRFPVPCELKMSYFLTSLDKASSAVQENDTKIIKFGWVILNLCPFLQIQSFSNFAGFCDRWAKNCVRTNLPYCVLWKPIDSCFFCCHGSMGFHKMPYGRFVPTQFFIHR